jgi:hypothetical protein
MADVNPYEHLDSHYGDMELRLVDEPTGSGKGMSSKEARTFLRALRPVTRVKQTLAQAAKKVTKKG